MLNYWFKRLQPQWLVGAIFTGICLVSANVQASSATITVTDNIGPHQIPAHVKKLIVYNPEILDTLHALGVHVAGVPKVETSLPAFLKEYDQSKYLNAGSMFEPDFEALSRFKPDLIIAGGRTTRADKELSKIAPTLNLDADMKQFPDSLLKQTIKLGQIFGKQQKAQQLVKEFKQEVAKTQALLPKQHKRALFILITGGRLSAFGPGSRFGFIYNTLNFTPALTQLKSTGPHGNLISSELLHQANPDWLFVLDRDAAIGRKDAKPATQVLNNPLVNSTNAAKLKHIVYVNPAEMYVAGGITTYLHAIKNIRQILKKQNQ